MQENIIHKYKSLIYRTKEILINGDKEWKVIFSEKKENNDVLSDHTLPYLFIITLITFVSYITNHTGYLFGLALIDAVRSFASYFIALFLIYILTRKILTSFVEKPISKNINLLSFKLVSYGFTIMFLSEIISLLIPQLYFIKFANILTFLIVWQGAGTIGKYEKIDYQVVLTIIISLLIIFMPYLLVLIFNKLNPGIL